MTWLNGVIGVFRSTNSDWVDWRTRWTWLQRKSMNVAIADGESGSSDNEDNSTYDRTDPESSLRRDSCKIGIQRE